MRSKELKFIVPIIFLSISCVLTADMQISPGHADTGGFEAVQIIELLQTNQILTSPERNKLSELVNGLIPAEEDSSVLRDLSLRMAQKVDNDKNGLKYLLVNLEKLANSEYARTIGKIEESDLKQCWKISDKLEEDIAAYRPSFPKPKKYRNVEYYMQIIKDSSVFLVGSKNLIVIPDLWESIQKTVKPAYLSWSRRNVDLLKQIKKHQKSFYSSSNFLTYKEMQFIQMFGLVQAGLRKFSESDSSDF